MKERIRTCFLKPAKELESLTKVEFSKKNVTEFLLLSLFYSRSFSK